jgi:AraC-like DNA-binding protein
MSPSTFRQHFRALTGVSPLQYQKQLRLQEARQLMLNENLDAGGAAVSVGYESASQFSREYSRLLARRLSAISRACGSLPLPPPTVVER